MARITQQADRLSVDDNILFMITQTTLQSSRDHQLVIVASSQYSKRCQGCPILGFLKWLSPLHFVTTCCILTCCFSRGGFRSLTTWKCLFLFLLCEFYDNSSIYPSVILHNGKTNTLAESKAKTRSSWQSNGHTVWFWEYFGLHWLW